MTLFVRFLALGAALLGAAPAAADVALPSGRILGNTGNGDVMFGPLKLGERQPGKWMLTPDGLKAALGAILPGRYHAKAFANPGTGLPCIWTPTGDAAPCIQAAIDAAAAAKGGEVIIDGGVYGVASPMQITTTGVRLTGAGVGNPRGGQNPNNFEAATRLVWRGASGATMMTAGTAPGAPTSAHAIGIDGVVFDCAAVAAVCAKIVHASHGRFSLGASEPTQTGIWVTTLDLPDGPGTQDNDFWLYSRVTSAASTATGIFIDGNHAAVLGGSNRFWNTSYNRFHRLSVWRASGDGIVFGDSDNNLIYDMIGYQQPAASGGRPIVFASTGYTSPNGQAASGAAYVNRSLHTGLYAHMAGYRDSSTVTPAGSNAGTAVFATVTKSTTAATGFNNVNATLTFANTTGLAPGLSVNCGGLNSGVDTGNVILTLPSSTSVLLASPVVSTVASGTSCAFSYGFTASAKVGTYTLTATSATSFNLTAPSGGTSQTGVTLTGGVLAFTDLVIPLSGTAAAGDTWTIMAPPTSSQNVLELVDKGNGVGDPLYVPGATGGWSTSFDPRMVLANLDGKAWAGYAPALAPSGGSGVTVNLIEAAYEFNGKTVRVRFTARIDYTGTAPNSVSIPLPLGVKLRGAQAGQAWVLSTGDPLMLNANQGAAALNLYAFGGPLVTGSGSFVAGSFQGEFQ